MNYQELISQHFLKSGFMPTFHKRLDYVTVSEDGKTIKDVSHGLAVKGINHAKHISLLSKDPSTQVGAVIMDRVGVVYSTGYNGYPRGFSDLNYDDRPYKYPRVVHAEANAIVNMVRTGTKMPDHAIMFVSGAPPCNECAKLICQAGIKEIVFDELSQFHSRHAEQTKIALELFSASSVCIGTIEYVYLNRILGECLKGFEV